MGNRFDTTAWSVIAAAQANESDIANAALETLCQRYWSPLYTYVRRKGYPPEEAQDLTQEFFARLLARGAIQLADRRSGRFRSFLLACMDNFLRDAWDHRTAQKRGGTDSRLSMDYALAEARYAGDREWTRDPRTAFDRRWAETLLESAMAQLEDEYRRAGKAELFRVLQGFLGRSGGIPAYSEAARELGLSEGALRTAVHRLRARFAAVARLHIAQTVQDEADIQEELTYLITVLDT